MSPLWCPFSSSSMWRIHWDCVNTLFPNNLSPWSFSCFQFSNYIISSTFISWRSLMKKRLFFSPFLLPWPSFLDYHYELMDSFPLYIRGYFLMLNVSQIWPVGSFVGWFLRLLNMTPLSLWSVPCFLVQGSLCTFPALELELAVLPRSPSFFPLVSP